MSDFAAAVKQIIGQEVPIQINFGRIQSTGIGRASVRLNGSPQTQQCSLAEHVQAETGDFAILVRPYQQSDWMVLAAFGSRNTLGPETEYQRSGHIAPPDNLRVDTEIPGTATVMWDAPISEPVVIEVQTNSVTEDDGNEISVLTTRGSYAIINPSSTTYVRVRSISTDLRVSGWTDWLQVNPVAVNPGLFQVDFTYLSASPLHIASVEAGTVALEVQLWIDTAFDGVTTLKVGETGANERLMAANENDPTETGLYVKTLYYEYPGSQDIYLYLSLISTTQGAGRVIVSTR